MTQANILTDQADDENVDPFAFSEQAHEDYKFAVTSQISVLLMGIVSAGLVVLLLAGLELSLRYSIASGWIDAPPTPKFYSALISQP